MLAFLLRLLGGKFGLVMAGGVAVVLLGAGVQTWRLDHAKADLTTARAAVTAWRKSTEAWRSARDAAEAVRALETATARQAVDGALVACDARVARAKASQSAIQSILTTEPPHDPANCPLRSLVPHDLLRDAIDPPG